MNLLYIDLFCGAGGTSTGVEKATVDGQKCAKVIACVNHDANAIASHEENHPDALHFTEDIRTLNLSPLVAHVMKWRQMCPSAKVVLWASLECTNFSKAKGGMPRDADSRTLAEHLFRYIDEINPEYIQIENVEEFMSWGELDEKGKPVSRLSGCLYERWLSDIQKRGYNFEYKILNSADFGAYTSRKRYFGIFAKYGLPIVFPEPTHAKNPQRGGLFQPLKKWKPVREVLDLSDEGESIFERKKPLVEATLERIYAGLIKFVAGGKEKWLLKYNSVNGKTRKHVAPSIEEPSPVISCQGRLGLISTSFLSKGFSGDPYSKNISIDDPAGAITTKDHHYFLSAYYGNGHNHSVEAPAPTLTTKDRIAFVDMCYGNGTPMSINTPAGVLTTNPKLNLVCCDPWVMNTSFSNIGASIDEPAQTITANRKWHYLLNPQYSSPGGSIDNPCFTLIARMDKMPPYLAECCTCQERKPSFISKCGESIVYHIYEYDTPMTKKIKEFMAIYGIIDIKMRMLRIPELKQIMGFPKDYKLIGTQAEQKKFIGNAVEVNMAKHLCMALAMKLREQLRA